MTTPAGPPEQTPDQPSPQQAQQIGTAAAEAATTPGQTPEQRQQATERAAQQAAKDQGVKISDEDARKIAEMTIAMLEQAGAFDQPPAPAQTSPAPGVEGQAATAGGGQTTPPPAPAPTAPGGQAGEPRRRSFAERFQGKS